MSYKAVFKVYKNELILYFAMVCLVFTLLVFIPYIGFILYTAVSTSNVHFKNSKTIDINNNYKWKYNGSHGFGNYKKLQNVQNSLLEIKKLNAIESSSVYGITKFSDMSKKEFAERMLITDTYCSNTLSVLSLYSFFSMIHKFEYNHKDIPVHFDWRDRGVVSPVLNQKRCNGCWAFSVVGVMETMLAIKKNERHSEELSIQELLDCSPNTAKCQGGNINTALWYLHRAQQPIVSASRYPLNLHDEGCQVNSDALGTRLLSYIINCNVDERIIPELIATHGPVMAVLNADMWQFYTGGIIHRSCGHDAYGYKHVVQIVGYDKSGDIPYYIAKNSWGTDFGEDGYVRLAMNEDVCGITRKIAYLDVY